MVNTQFNVLPFFFPKLIFRTSLLLLLLSAAMELHNDFAVVMCCEESMTFLAQLKSSVDGISTRRRFLKTNNGSFCGDKCSQLVAGQAFQATDALLDQK
ncbi:MAG: hypothetical protein NHB32_14950 [Fischerella sp. CENA71]|nr:hypothetical protein [Fischerella sp. CENA71]